MEQQSESSSLATVPAGELARRDDLGVPVEHLIARVEKIREVRSRVMTDGVHYGKIPGTGDKPSLLKPGAETLCMTFQLAPIFDLKETRDGDHLEVIVTCELQHIPTGTKLGNGIGSCSTRESKYAYRKSDRLCPKCGKPALLKSKHHPEWFCWAKKDGCGTTFPLNDKRIIEQVVGRVENPDLADQYNTVRKMACKRAHVAAVLFVTGASEFFTQDVEDLPLAEQGAPVPAADTPPAAGPAANAKARTNNSKRKAPSAAELATALDAIAEAQTVEEIASLLKGGAHAWTKAQREQLSAAGTARKNELEQSGDAPGNGDSEDADEDEERPGRNPDDPNDY